MRPLIRVGDLLHIGAASALVAVPFVPYVAIGEQPYAAIGFIERVNGLRGTQIIDASWLVPPALALATSLSVVVVIALPRAHRTMGHMAATLLATVSALLAYLFTNQSVILHPLMVPRLLVFGAVLSLCGIAIDQLTISRSN